MAPRRKAANYHLINTRGLVGAIQQAAADAVSGTGNGVQAIAAGFAAQLGNKSDLAKAHAKVGERMIEAMLEAYDRKVEGAKEGPEERDSPARNKGKLRPALADSRMIKANAQGIEFVNIAVLRARANHYRRLNYGTEGIGRPGESSPNYPLTLFGAYLFSIGTGQESRPMFALPPGLFYGVTADVKGLNRWTYPGRAPSNTGVFTPLGELPTKALKGRVAKAAARGDFDKPTRGIKPRRFIEAGVQQLTESLPQEYDVLVRRWIDRGTKAGKAYQKTVKVRGKAIPRVTA